MKYLSIDLGTYSVKYCIFSQERRRLRLIASKEFLVDDFQNEEKSLSIGQVHTLLLAKILGSNPIEGKTISQLPHEYVTTRFLNLPVNNKKKAELMIPFQLDEELPYDSSEIHFSPHFLKDGDNFFSITSSCNRNDFEKFIGLLENQNAAPDILTSEVSILQSFIGKLYPDQTYLLVDMGHNTSKIYLIKNQRLSSVYTSYIGGRRITDTIAQTYGISDQEATEYKHQNAFLLTDGQVADVSEDQKEFADLMGKTLNPLVQDIKRLELGFRVNNGIKVQNIFLLGGSSEIRNIENFFTEKLNIRTRKFDRNLLTTFVTTQMQDHEMRSYFYTGLQAEALLNREPISNFRKGEFASTGTEEIPLYSAGFIGARVLILSFILVVTLITENVILKIETKRVSAKVQKNLKLNIFGFKAVDLRAYKKRPIGTLRRLKKHYNVVTQEVNTLMAATELKGLSPLMALNTILDKNKEVTLEFFESDSEFVRANFSATTLEELQKLKDRLEDAFSGNKINVDMNEERKFLEVTYEIL